MAKQQKKLTENQKAYQTLEKKLKRRIRELKKRGYSFDEIKTPEKITKRVIDKLKEIAENIYKYARYYDPLQDKYISGEERLKQERQISARKGWETRRKREATKRTANIEPKLQEWLHEATTLPSEEKVILDTVRDWVNTWSPSPLWSSELAQLKEDDKNALKSLVDGAINQLGEEQVCRNLEKKAYEFMQLCNEILYASGSKYKDSGREGIRDSLNKISYMIWGRPLTVKESADITSLSESFNEAL